MKGFVAKIMTIQAPAQNMFGGGIPGMMGMSGSVNQAAMTGGGDVIIQLEQKTIELARLQLGHVSHDDITAKVKEVEGLLLVASTLSILTEAQTTTLLDELHTIFEE